MNRLRPLRGGLWLLAALLAASRPVAARDDRGVVLTARYQQECGACHVAYAPRLLPADAWARLMKGLPTHYGTDASLDAATANELGAWLGANAGTSRRLREPPPEDRITRSAWFIRKHDELPAAVWKRPAVRSAANCIACHAGADRGDFDEHDVRIPR